jgi:hypothetical protein
MEGIRPAPAAACWSRPRPRAGSTGPWRARPGAPVSAFITAGTTSVSVGLSWAMQFSRAEASKRACRMTQAPAYSAGKVWMHRPPTWNSGNTVATVSAGVMPAPGRPWPCWPAGCPGCAPRRAARRWCPRYRPATPAGWRPGGTARAAPAGRQVRPRHARQAMPQRQVARGAGPCSVVDYAVRRAVGQHGVPLGRRQAEVQRHQQGTQRATANSRAIWSGGSTPARQCGHRCARPARAARPPIAGCAGATRRTPPPRRQNAAPWRRAAHGPARQADQPAARWTEKGVGTTRPFT